LVGRIAAAGYANHVDVVKKMPLADRLGYAQHAAVMGHYGWV
jgi:hypothetical protein